MAAPGGPSPDDPFAHTRMTLGEHLDELRRRLFRGILALVLLFAVGLVYRDLIAQVILAPNRDTVARVNRENLQEAEERVRQHPEERERFFEPGGRFRFVIDDRLKVLSPVEGMWFTLKVAGLFALFLGSPYLLWQLWGFVAAGLYAREKRWVRYFFPPALVLFTAGVAFSYFVLVPFGLYYLLRAMPLELMAPEFRLENYFGFLSLLCLGMAVVFQLPLLMTFVSRAGLVAAATFPRLRGYFVIAAFVIAAVLTPGPDIFSQLAMGVPMVLLYEIGILGARLAGRSRAREAAV
jgi:sec-independent protein translocase protein TatC